MGELKPRLLDGGLATTLQAEGLPPFHPVEPWLLERPAAIREAHRAFVDAGAEIVLTATFQCLPSARGDWATLVPIAVDLARSVAPEVWLSLGPGAGHGRVAAIAEVDGIVLETFTDADALEHAVREVRQVYSGPLVASLVPLTPFSAGVPAQLAQAGADGVGLNCCSGATIRAQLARWSLNLPLWLKPHPDALQQQWPQATWVGGCCGTTPELLAQFSRAGPKTAN